MNLIAPVLTMATIIHNWSTGSKLTRSTRAGLAISCVNILRVTAHDFSSWVRLYGLWGATAMTTFGKKSVWKTQIEALNSPYAFRSLGSVGGTSGDRSGGSGPPGDPPGGPPNPRGSGGFGGRPRRFDDDNNFCDQAAREFKDIVGIESNRVSLSVCCFPELKSFVRDNNRETGCYHYRSRCYRSGSPRAEPVSLGRSRILDL